MKNLVCFILLSIIVGGFAHKHTCVHDKISQEFKPHLLEETEEDSQNRLLQPTTTRDIRIVIDESNLVSVTAQQRDMIVGKLVPVATQFLSRRLKVQTRGSNLRVPIAKCYQANVPQAHQTTGLDADLIIYVTASNEPSQGFIAWATSCLQDSVTRRPIAGQINFNLHYLKFEADKFEEQVDTTLHEITHILAFSGNLYRHFMKSFGSRESAGEANVFARDVLLRGAPRQIIRSPKVLETARKYFNCPTINGVEIENEGGSGSAGAHWERAILHNEQMTASSIPDASFSEFTLSLLQDSGWYQVDFSRAEPMFFGQGAGCDFVNNGCKSTVPRREWCNPTQRNLCSFNYKFRSQCASETFSDGCHYARGFSNGNCEVATNGQGDARGETYGVGSRCIIGSVMNKRFVPQGESTLCYRYTCTVDRKIKFFPKAGGEVICSTAGQVVQVGGEYTGTITCPDPVAFCRDYYPSCPNSCTSKGYCVRGVCECRAGFKGADCSVVG
jgi:hypothetical protein